MKIKPFFSLLLLTALTATLQAQDVQKETVKTGKKSSQVITSTSLGMYDGTDSPEAQGFFEQGMKAGQEGNYKIAKKLYKKAIKADPEFVEAYDNVGAVCRRLDNYGEAIEFYKKSLEIYPEGTMARQNLAVVYGLQNNNQAAKNEYEKMTELQPGNPEGWFGMANADMVLGNLDAAQTSANKAVGLYKLSNSHHLADGYQLLGIIQFYKQDLSAAKKTLTKAKELGAQIHPQIEQAVFSGNAETKSEESELKLESKEDYEKLEPAVLEAYEYYMNTPVGTAPKERANAAATIMIWLTGTPYVTIEISENVVPYMECEKCLMAFMGSYMKYALDNKDSAIDKHEAKLFATEKVIAFYTKNQKELGRNKDLDKFVQMQKDGTLSAHLKE